MGVLKTLLLAGLCAVSLTAQARADPQRLALTMAGCIGRFSAEMEHAWLMQDARSAVLADQRKAFADHICQSHLTGWRWLSLSAHGV